MKTYHITYNPDNSYHATGKNYTAKSMRDAIEMFTLEFPNVDPIACSVKK